MADWVSVKDQMPKLFHSVLVSDGKYVGVGEYCGETNLGFKYWSCDFGTGFVTHWMPLPEPPKGEN